MSPNILVVLGSPRRNGNSALLAREIAENAEAGGAEVETVFLNELSIKPCQGCDGCQQIATRECVIDDDMRPLYSKLQRADTVVIASPIYWFNVSAQTKIFIDRLYAVGIGEKNIFKGKNFAVALTFADENKIASGADNALRLFQDMGRYLGVRMQGMVYGSAGAAGEIAHDTDLMERAGSLGRYLATVGTGVSSIE